MDFVIAPIYILAILLYASSIQNKKIKENPGYRYFTLGIAAKIVGAVGLCLIYVYYYDEGGDTISYNADSSSLLKLLFRSPSDFFDVWLAPLTRKTRYYFPNMLYFSSDSNAFMVCRLLVPIRLICFDSYLLSSIVMAVVSFTGVWKLYEVFCDCYPALYKHFALAVIFTPSVVFWGSGMLKDSWTLAAAGWYCYSLYMIFIKGGKLLSSVVTLLIAMFLLITIKPYIFVGLLPGSMLWMIWSRIAKIKSTFLKIIIAPSIMIAGMGLGIGLWMLTSSNLGEYGSLDSMILKASVASEDLKQDYYQGNSFDLGAYDPTLVGMLSKFPIATVTGLFRPFILEAKNIVMAVSGLENLFILGFAFIVLLRKPRTALMNLFTNPLVLFCLIFAVFFAFSVAISTSNFGALVRLRIPLMPFLLSGLMIVNYANKSAGISSQQSQTL